MATYLYAKTTLKGNTGSIHHPASDGNANPQGGSRSRATVAAFQRDEFIVARLGGSRSRATFAAFQRDGFIVAGLGGWRSRATVVPLREAASRRFGSSMACYLPCQSIRVNRTHTTLIQPGRRLYLLDLTDRSLQSPLHCRLDIVSKQIHNNCTGSRLHSQCHTWH